MIEYRRNKWDECEDTLKCLFERRKKIENITLSISYLPDLVRAAYNTAQIIFYSGGREYFKESGIEDIIGFSDFLLSPHKKVDARLTIFTGSVDWEYRIDAYVNSDKLFMISYLELKQPS